MQVNACLSMAPLRRRLGVADEAAFGAQGGDQTSFAALAYGVAGGAMGHAILLLEHRLTREASALWELPRGDPRFEVIGDGRVEVHRGSGRVDIERRHRAHIDHPRPSSSCVYV